MGQQVWLLFTEIGNPPLYTFHGVFDNKTTFDQAVRTVANQGTVFTIETKLNILKSEDM